ncbi:MAG: putative adenosylcobinamide amidohydrolase [Acidimicrobiaceae bacterium]|nr:putative adenosylcobinamide amidohydrolase [Acidimicrobiaceae bacterium]
MTPGVLRSRAEGGVELDVLVWRLASPTLCASTTTVGGGIGARWWILNAQVAPAYGRVDTETHVEEIASTLGLRGSGVGMLTAAPVAAVHRSSDEGVNVEATVGLTHPTWAASDEDGLRHIVGTINVVAFLPVRLDDGALLNALATATEAKAQALWEASVPATGTPSDALCLVCPLEGDRERFGGPRSLWGARLARAVRECVLAGAR